ncbi:hypothetical protein J3F83DRAFT_26402 [Trichoderma novae-zelandiae]
MRSPTSVPCRQDLQFAPTQDGREGFSSTTLCDITGKKTHSPAAASVTRCSSDQHAMEPYPEASSNPWHWKTESRDAERRGRQRNERGKLEACTLPDSPRGQLTARVSRIPTRAPTRHDVSREHGGASEVQGEWPAGFPRCMAYDSRARRGPRTYSAPSSSIRLVHVSTEASARRPSRAGKRLLSEDTGRGGGKQEHGQSVVLSGTRSTAALPPLGRVPTLVGSFCLFAHHWEQKQRHVSQDMAIKQAVTRTSRVEVNGHGSAVAQKQHGIRWPPRRVDRCRLSDSRSIGGSVSGQLCSGEGLELGMRSTRSTANTVLLLRTTSVPLRGKMWTCR